MGLGIVASCWSFGGTRLHYTLATAFVNIMITTCTEDMKDNLPFNMPVDFRSDLQACDLETFGVLEWRPLYFWYFLQRLLGSP
jgi:hypothetical protein